jgi:hypothetical protein
VRGANPAEPLTSAQVRPVSPALGVLLARYGVLLLAFLAGLEWLLGRTISRLAAAPNLDGTPRQVVEAIGSIGLDLIDPAFLIALLLLFLFVVRRGSPALVRRDVPTASAALVLGVFGTVSAAAWLLPRSDWLGISYNFFSMAAVLALWLRFNSREQATLPFKGAVIASVLGYLCWYAYVLSGGASGGGLYLLNAGEVLLLLVPFLLFAAISVPHRQWKRPGRWILPVILMLLFTAANVADILVDQGFTGVFTLWSVGYTLYLPWPVYVVALGLFTHSVLTAFARNLPRAAEANRGVAVAMLLFLYAGFTLQLTYQHLLAALALVLLTGFASPFPRVRPAPLAYEEPAAGASTPILEQPST